MKYCELSNKEANLYFEECQLSLIKILNEIKQRELIEQNIDKKEIIN